MISTAIIAGFLAGLFGIGGGLIMVPFLFYIFNYLEVNPDYLMHLAVGTSFAIIIPTSIVSVYTHFKLNGVDIDLVKSYGIFSVFGVISGTVFATFLTTKPLMLFFACIIFFFSSYLLFFKQNEEKILLSIKIKYKIIFGFISGFISAPMGIAGGIMNVPVFKFFGYQINKAIGTAAAIGFFISLFGAVSFLISGSYLNVNLKFSYGFINIPAFLIFIPITTLMARVGAKTVHRIDKNKISKYFGLFLLIVGIKFIYQYISF